MSFYTHFNISTFPFYLVMVVSNVNPITEVIRFVFEVRNNHNGLWFVKSRLGCVVWKCLVILKLHPQQILPIASPAR